ncbi:MULTISPECIES: HD domain-containing protein [Methylosinus]|nr:MULTISPECIES: HD domain-containing protein [Methylosinus]
MGDTPARDSSDLIVEDVDILFEIGTLRHIHRSWRQFGGLPFANVAEHSFRMAFIGMVIAVHEGANVDRVVQLALAHDLPESRTGDANYVQKMYRHDDVEAAAREMDGRSALATHFDALRTELMAGITIEAKIVKDADNLDCDFELKEMRDKGANIAEALAPTREAVKRTLHTDTARRLFDTVNMRSSHAWHLNARNRFNAGDWKQEEK